MQRLLYRLFWVFLPPLVSWDSHNGFLSSLSLTLCTFDVGGICTWSQIIWQQKILVFSSISISWFQIKTTLQRHNNESSKKILPEKETPGLSPNFHIHVSVSELYIPTMGLPVLLEEICRLILEIGAEATLFPEKEYVNGIAVAMYTAKTQ